MRQLKFRIYNTTLGVMSYTYPYIVGIALGALWFNTEPVVEEGEYIIMQYIGLRDKNGKEIYEGDIVLDSISNCSCGFTGEVKFGEHDTDSFDYESSRAYGFYLNRGEHSLSFSSWNMDEEDLEVLGNIYENPERLRSCKT